MLISDGVKQFKENMTTTCEVKIGFYVLKQCGFPVVGSCQHCGISLCETHNLAKAQGEFVCVDCYAEIYMEHEYTYDPEAEPEATKRWFGKKRKTVYDNTDYEPFDTADYDGFNRRYRHRITDDSMEDSFYES